MLAGSEYAFVVRGGIDFFSYPLSPISWTPLSLGINLYLPGPVIHCSHNQGIREWVAIALKMLHRYEIAFLWMLCHRWHWSQSTPKNICRLQVCIVNREDYPPQCIWLENIQKFVSILLQELCLDAQGSSHVLWMLLVGLEVLRYQRGRGSLLPLNCQQGKQHGQLC